MVMTTVEDSVNDQEDIRHKQQIDKDISAIESRKNRMTDMLVDGIMTREVYDAKCADYKRKLHTLDERRLLLEEVIRKRKNVGKRMAELRNTLESHQVLDKFDRVVFESIVEKEENSAFPGFFGGLDLKPDF